MNNPQEKSKEDRVKLSRSKSEHKKSTIDGGKGNNKDSFMRRNNTDRKELNEKRMKRKIKSRFKKSKSPVGGKSTNQKIQNWGLELFKKSEDGIQDIILREKIYEILTGENHMFFLTKNKKVYGIGNNECGQLGLPNVAILQQPMILHFSDKISVSRVFVGADFSFCMSVSHQVYSWGLNLKGQLGLGHYENVSYPALVKSFNPFNSKSKHQNKSKLKPRISLLSENELIVDISCGSLHTLTLTNKSKVFSCGYGENYSLGHNSATTMNQFKEISFFHQLSSSSSHKIEKICSGTSHSGALIAGKVYLWGTFAHSKYCLNKIPNAVHLTDAVADFVVGDLLTVILTKTGQVFTLGENTDCQLGTSEENDYSLVSVNLPCKIEYICCGLNHIIAINNSKGKIFGWGSNRFGQIHPNSSFEFFSDPFELPWMFAAKAYIITCGPFSTVLVSAKRSKINSHGNSNEELETITDLKKEIDNIKKKAKKINQENEKLKEEITTLHATINTHMDSFNGSSSDKHDSDHDSDSKSIFL